MLKVSDFSVGWTVELYEGDCDFGSSPFDSAMCSTKEEMVQRSTLILSRQQVLKNEKN